MGKFEHPPAFFCQPIAAVGIILNPPLICCGGRCEPACDRAAFHDKRESVCLPGPGKSYACARARADHKNVTHVHIDMHIEWKVILDTTR